jgi:uridine kinase
MDIKIFVDTDDDLRFIRRLMRDIKERDRTVNSVIEQYMKIVRPMHIEFVEPSRRYADIIIPEGHNPVAINMVASIIKEKILTSVKKIKGKKHR